MSGAEDANQPPRERRMLIEEQRAHHRERARILGTEAAQAKREARACDIPQQMENRRTENRKRMRAARARATPEKACIRRAGDNEATRFARAQETPEQARLRREAASEATRSARTLENIDQSRRRKESDNYATAVGRRIVPAAPSTASAAAYVDFGNMDVECKNCCAL